MFIKERIREGIKVGKEFCLIIIVWKIRVEFFLGGGKLVFKFLIFDLVFYIF